MASATRYAYRSLALALALCLLALGTIADSGDKPQATTAYAAVSGPVDRLRARYIERVLENAKARGVKNLILHLNTDGGPVASARQIFQQLLKTDSENLRVIAFIDNRAISAGALVAYASHEVYLTETASIGDIGVIFRGADGEIKYAPEKIETVIRTLLAQAAELRGWPSALLVKMTARQQELYRITQKDGKQLYIIEDQLATYLADNPQIKRDDPAQLVLYLGKDRLLTVSGREAARLGLATELVDDLSALYTRFGVEEKDVVDLSPSPIERVAWISAPIAPILAGLALLFIVFELKTPGVGVWALLALICASGFVLAQYTLEMLQNIELLMIVVGIGLLVLEAMLVLSGGLLLWPGALLVFGGLVLAFVPDEVDFDFQNEIFIDALRSATLSALSATAIAAVGFLYMLWWLPRSSLRHRYALSASIDSTSSGELEHDAQALVGQYGKTVSTLRPNGMVEVGARRFDARSEHGTWVDNDSSVVVRAVEFGTLVVQSSPENQSDDGTRDDLDRESK